jgi:hypothetical protein
MVVNYNDLAVGYKAAGKDAWSKIEQVAINELVNLLLAENNPGENGKLKTGIIWFERDQTKGFLNYIWKSVLSGLKSSAGINNKSQREVRRAEKKMKN